MVAHKPLLGRCYILKKSLGIKNQGEHYRVMINDFFTLKFENVYVDALWFQHNGAKCHTTNETLNLLKEPFGEHIISGRGAVA